MSPPEGGGGPEEETASHTTGNGNHHEADSYQFSPWPRRRDCSARTTPLESGLRDSWRPYRGRCGEYAVAAQHIADAGFLPAPPLEIEDLRSMSRTGDQRLAEWIARSWEGVA